MKMPAGPLWRILLRQAGQVPGGEVAGREGDAASCGAPLGVIYTLGRQERMSKMNIVLVESTR
jgi:hypothetical protein